MGMTNWLLVFIVLLLIQSKQDHEQLMRLLSDLATMIGDGLDEMTNG